jgi:hypothetical protein
MYICGSDCCITFRRSLAQSFTVLALPPRHPIGFPSQSERILLRLRILLTLIADCYIIHSWRRNVSCCYFKTTLWRRSSSTSSHEFHIAISRVQTVAYSFESIALSRSACTVSLLGPRHPAVGLPSQSATV